MKDRTLKGCRFLLGASGVLVVALAGELPKNASTYTLRATDKELIFRAGVDEIARFPFENETVFNELTKLSSIGAIECVEDQPFPGELTNMLYVETLRASA